MPRSEQNVSSVVFRDVTNDRPGHLLDRTSPRGAPFVGRCRYCGEEGLSARDALRPCPGAVSRDQSVLDALEDR